MSYKYCTVPLCRNTTVKTPEKIFVNVPKDAQIRKNWFDLARKSNPDGFSANSVLFFCEDHFNMEKEMLNYMQYTMGFSNNVIMVKGVLPSIFHCQQDRSKRTILHDSAFSQPAYLKLERNRLIKECQDTQECEDILTTTTKQANITTESLQICDKTLSTKPSVAPKKSIQCKANFRSKPALTKALTKDTTVSSFKYSTTSNYTSPFKINPCHSHEMDNTVNRLIHSLPITTLDHAESPGDNSVYYRCGSCKDSFTSKETCDMHMNRLSVSIYYPCSVCNDVVHFTNRCRALAHHRRHSNKQSTLDYSKLIIKPLSIDGLKKRINDFCDKQFNSTKSYFLKNKERIIQSAQSQTKQNDGNLIENNQLNHVPGVLVGICRFCCKALYTSNFENAKDVYVNHFRRLAYTVGSYFCKECSRVLPNKCAFSCHKNIHKGTSTRICPECGSHIPNGEDFQKHLNEVCMHFSRCLILQCNIDNCLFQVNEKYMKEHFIFYHSSPICKCDKCNLFFKKLGINVSDNIFLNIPLPHHPVLQCKVCASEITEDDILTHAWSHYQQARKLYYRLFCESCKIAYEDRKSHTCPNNSNSEREQTKIGSVNAELNATIQSIVKEKYEAANQLRDNSKSAITNELHINSEIKSNNQTRKKQSRIVESVEQPSVNVELKAASKSITNDKSHTTTNQLHNRVKELRINTVAEINERVKKQPTVILGKNTKIFTIRVAPKRKVAGENLDANPEKRIFIANVRKPQKSVEKASSSKISEIKESVCCQICNEVFNDKHLYTVHLFTKHIKSFQNKNTP